MQEEGILFSCFFEKVFSRSFPLRSCIFLVMIQGDRFSTFGIGEYPLCAISECSLGSILVAATAVGVCSVMFGDDPQMFLHELERSFPHMNFREGDRRFQKVVDRVVRFVERPTKTWDLPLDIHGTDFQRRVWQALMKIPLGRTASYAEIARAIGRPSATRAVAQACGANNIAVAIPCHRVVRSDGSLSGYRWGIARKAALLKRERR